MIKYIVIAVVTALLLGGCTRTPTYTLEASIGTYLQQREASSSNTRLGTVLVVKLREDGSPLKASVSFTLTGPEGFTPLKETYLSGGEWIIVPLPQVAPIAGKYQLELSSGLTQTLELKDVSQTLPLTNITATLENTTINVSWESVPGAVGYYVNLFNTNGGTKAKPTQYTLSTQAQFTDVPVTNYAVGVYTLNFDTVASDPELPSQLVMSDSIALVKQETEVRFPSQLLARATLVIKK